jgi:exonuclease SbcC
MKFLKVYIKNFKGLRRVNIVDLDESTTLLTGPNGFGKTTIFDAIELCLTGSLHRTEVKKGVTNDRKDYIKPFFQNDVNDEVTLKLLLENKRGEKLTIVRHLHKDKKKRPKVDGKENKAHEFGILNLFTENIDSFSQQSFDLDNAEEFTQGRISDFFEFADTDIDIGSIYPIFNYLQQEETTFFLKKSEHDRKNSLGFLLRTDTQEEKLKSINEKHKKLCDLRDFFNEKLIAIKSNTPENFEYKKVFPGQEIDFDVKEPFVDVIDSDLHVKSDGYISKINKLSTFIKQFTPAEFRLKENSEKVKSLIISAHEFKEHYVLQNFLQDSKYKKLQALFKDINNKELIEGFILQNILNQADTAIKVNKTIENISKFKEAKGKDKDNYLKPLVTTFLPNSLDSHTSLVSSRNSLSTNLQGLNKTVFELKNTIRDLEEHFSKLQSKEDICKCPYCGSKFGDLDQLSISMKDRLVTFDSLTSDNSEELNKVNLRIENEINKPIRLKVNEFEKSNSKFDEVLIQKL